MDNDFVCYTIECLKLGMPPPLEINLETKQFKDFIRNPLISNFASF